MRWTPERAFAAFRKANPYPVRPLLRPGDAQEALLRAKGESPGISLPANQEGHRRGLLVAAATFLLVLTIGSIALLIARDTGPIADDPIPPVVSSTTTTTLQEPGPELQANLERFAAAYSSGDFASVQSLLEPGVRRVVQWDRNEFVSQTLERVADLYEIEAKLNTTISFRDCRLVAESRATCDLLREDDLTRALHLEPQEDGRTTLEFSDGIVVSWDEQQPSITPYDENAARPFVVWVLEARPDFPHPSPCNGCPQWQTNIGLADVIESFVEEWTATLD